MGQTVWTDSVTVGVRVAASYKSIENDCKTKLRYNKYEVTEVRATGPEGEYTSRHNFSQ